MEPTPLQLEIILKVIDRIAPKYPFGFYDLDDIKQESYIICLAALPKYDNSRPFENFISRHLSNKLKTLVRDKYHRKSTSDKHAKLIDNKKKLTDLKELSYETLFYEENLEESMDHKEAVEKVLRGLSPSLRNDWNRLVNGVSIQSSRKNLLFAKVREILGEDW